MSSGKDSFEPTTEMFDYPIISVFAGNILLFLFCQSRFGKRDNSWIDVMWSLSFVAPNALLLFLRYIESKNNPEARITKKMYLVN